MENNSWPAGQFNQNQANKLASSVKENVIENFQEFKHCVRLHEKGLEMQECASQSTQRIKQKVHSISGKHNHSEIFSESNEEVSELRQKFEEKHQ